MGGHPCLASEAGRLRTSAGQAGGQMPPLELSSVYLAAKEAVISAGFAGEIDWQHDVSFGDLTERAFLREAAWVVLSAGLSAAVVSKKFGAFSAAFLDWTSASKILAKRQLCRRKALTVFGNRRKVEAILSIVGTVATDGFGAVKDGIRLGGIAFLREFPHMGPATAYHLAKNIGLPVVKPDRHLLRVARSAGYDSPEELCSSIAEVVADPLPVVDLVIWRYATLHRDYVERFSLSFRGHP